MTTRSNHNGQAVLDWVHDHNTDNASCPADSVQIEVVDDFEATPSPRFDHNANTYVENGREIVAVGIRILDGDAGTGHESLGGPSGIAISTDAGGFHFSAESGADETITSVLIEVVDNRIATKRGRPIATAHYDIEKNTLLCIEVDAEALVPTIRDEIEQDDEPTLKTDGWVDEGRSNQSVASSGWEDAADDDTRCIADYVQENYPHQVADWTFQHQNGEDHLFMVYERGEKNADGTPVTELYICGEKGRGETYAVQYWDREWGTAATARYLGRYKRESSAWERAVELMRKPDF